MNEREELYRRCRGRKSEPKPKFRGRLTIEFQSKRNFGAGRSQTQIEEQGMRGKPKARRPLFNGAWRRSVRDRERPRRTSICVGNAMRASSPFALRRSLIDVMDAPHARVTQQDETRAYGQTRIGFMIDIFPAHGFRRFEILQRFVGLMST